MPNASCTPWYTSNRTGNVDLWTSDNEQCTSPTGLAGTSPKAQYEEGCFRPHTLPLVAVEYIAEHQLIDLDLVDYDDGLAFDDD